jgi:hypothetical protein
LAKFATNGIATAFSDHGTALRIVLFAAVLSRFEMSVSLVGRYRLLVISAKLFLCHRPAESKKFCRLPASNLRKRFLDPDIRLVCSISGFAV